MNMALLKVEMQKKITMLNHSGFLLGQLEQVMKFVLENKEMITADDRKNILSCSHLISDELAQYLEDNDFYSQSASATHHSNYRGGLFDHSMLVYIELQKLTNKLDLKWSKEHSPFYIGLFHDLCKIDLYEEDCREFIYSEPIIEGHGIKSVVLLQSHGIRLTEEEQCCMIYHMGAYVDKSEWGALRRAIKKYPNILYTHLADNYVAQVLEV